MSSAIAPLPPLNGGRRAFTGQVVVMTDTDRAAHAAFTAEQIAALAPEGPLEWQFAQSIAEDLWRLNRLRSMEDNIFALGHFGPAGNIDAEHPEIHAALTQARVFMREARNINVLSLCEQRLNRAIQRNLELLLKLQELRRSRVLGVPDAAEPVPASAETKPLTMTASHLLHAARSRSSAARGPALSRLPRAA